MTVGGADAGSRHRQLVTPARDRADSGSLRAAGLPGGLAEESRLGRSLIPTHWSWVLTCVDTSVVMALDRDERRTGVFVVEHAYILEARVDFDHRVPLRLVVPRASNTTTRDYRLKAKR